MADEYANSIWRTEMKTTYQHRQDSIKRMEGSRPTRQYIEEACYLDTGDMLMVLQEYATPEFAKALMMTFNNRSVNNGSVDHHTINCLVIAYHDMVKRYASQFEDESDE